MAAMRRGPGARHRPPGREGAAARSTRSQVTTAVPGVHPPDADGGPGCRAVGRSTGATAPPEFGPRRIPRLSCGVVSEPPLPRAGIRARRGGHRRRAPLGLATTIAALALVTAAVVPAGASEVPEPPEPPEPAATCAGRAATIAGVEGDGVIAGTPGDDVIVGTPGDDVIVGRGGNDVICALTGDDLIVAGAGADRVIGGPGRDRILGGAGNDVALGGPGRDRLDGGPGRDRLVGGAGRDQADGGRGRDLCIGGPGADRNVTCERLAPASRRPAVHAIGDSVLLGATDAYCAALARAVPGIVEDASVSRHFTVGIDLVAAARATTSGEMVFVIALGTNGPFADADLDALVRAAGRNSRFVFVNIHAPRAWEDTVNGALAAGVARHANRAVLVDWYGLAAEDRTLTGSDEIHLTCDGAASLAAAIAEGVAHWS